MNSRQAFNYSDFVKIASRHESDFADFGVVVTQGTDEGSTYTFKDNGSNVLGIAHLDTVQEASYSSLIKVKREQVIVCPRLDDRLGVYIITKLLPKLGITCDWLLTTGEEIGQSSAALFRTGKQYNWAFQFDRAGTDIVLYHYEHKALKKVMRKAGFKIGQGSFSDISSLDIGCSGINFGCGYHDAHSLTSYAFVSDTCKQVEKFRKFWTKYSDTKLPYSPSSKYERWSYSSGYIGYGSNHGYSGYPSSRSSYGYASYSEPNYSQDRDYYYGLEQEKQYLDWSLESQSKFDRDLEKQYIQEQEQALEDLADTALDNGK